MKLKFIFRMLFTEPKKKSRKLNLQKAIPYLITLSVCLISIFIARKKQKFSHNPVYIGNFKGRQVNDSFSVMIATYAPRAWAMRRQMKKIAYGQCPHLKHIYICWVDRKNPIPQLSFFGIDEKEKHVPITIIPTVSGFITDRFIVPDGMDTDTMLILDDDLDVDGHEIDNAFVVYKENRFNDRIFGLRTRAFWDGHYNIFEYKVPYNMVITNFAFLTVDMLKAYNKPEYKELRDHCVKVRNCDDILMAYIVSHQWKKAPVAMELNVNHLGKIGISFGFSHRKKRDACCKMFEKFFGYDVVGSYESQYMLRRSW
jgi:hypothetical protein